MNWVGRLLGSKRLGFALELARAAMWRARGICLGKRSRFGSGVKITRPWTMVAGKGLILEHLVFVKAVNDDARLRLGDDCFIGFATEINVMSSISIGNRVLIAPHCFIVDHNHNFAKPGPISKQGCSSAAIVIKDDVWIGAGVVVLPGVTIGEGAVVGAGSVVTKSIPSGVIAGGVPARIIGGR